MANRGREIAIITDDPGWHGHQLVAAFSKRGFSSQFVRLQDCHFSITNAGVGGLHIGSFTSLPLGVFIRGVPGGSLEEVVFYLDVLHALEAMQIPVINNTRSIERSVDKGMTSFLLSLHGISTPNTIVSSDLHYFRSKLREGMDAGKNYVIKPLFGSQGKGLQRIHNVTEFLDYEFFHGVMYAQEFVDSGHGVGVDYRMFVVGEKVIASMKRIGVNWISNVAQGAQVEAIKLNADVEQQAIAAVRAIGMEYAGVDIIQDQQGKYWVTEVNSVPAWKGLQKTTETPIAEVIIDDFLRRCG